MTQLAPIDAETVATLQARAALAGWELAHLPDGTFLISRWGLHRELQDVAAVEQFLERVRPGGSGG